MDDLWGLVRVPALGFRPRGDTNMGVNSHASAQSVLTLLILN